MKIKYNGYTSFNISIDGLSILTDPVLSKSKGAKGISKEADVILNVKPTENKEFTPVNRKGVFEINSSGEYELSGMMIQRPLGTNFYVLDSDLTRLVFIGTDSQNVDPKHFVDLGDVDVLLLPGCNGKEFPNYELLQTIIEKVDPAVLVPYGFSEKGENTKTREEFLKYFGFSNYREEKTLKVVGGPEAEERVMEIVFLG